MIGSAQIHAINGESYVSLADYRDLLFVVVERRRPDASYGMFTYRLTRRGARRAAELWERHGELEGWAP